MNTFFNQETACKKNLAIILSLICTLGGACICLGGAVVSAFRLLSDARQLKLDANLDQQSILLAGGAGIMIGLLLMTVGVFLWLCHSRQKFGEEQKKILFS